MNTIEKTIEVDVPVRTAYNQWTQFEQFPRFMEGVKAVTQLGPKRLHWKAELIGKEVEWDAEITDQVPDDHVAWRSTSGVKNDGMVAFQALSPTSTRIRLRIDYETEGTAQATAGALGLVSARVSGDLARFKKFIESRGTETGAWRGEIHGQQVSGGQAST